MSLIPALNLNETLADYLFLIVLRHFDAPLAPLTGVTPSDTLLSTISHLF